MASLVDTSSASGSDASGSHAGSSSRNISGHSLSAWAKHVSSAPQKAKGYSECIFEMHYCTDELVHYCLRNASDTGLQMASMLYSFIFTHDVLATFLLPEGRELALPAFALNAFGQLGHFLSFFPEKRNSFRGLTELEQRFLDRIALRDERSG